MNTISWPELQVVSTMLGKLRAEYVSALSAEAENHAILLRKQIARLADRREQIIERLLDSLPEQIGALD